MKQWALAGWLLLSLLALPASAQVAGISSGAFGDRHWKAPVADVAHLPATGNAIADCRRTITPAGQYCWSGAAWVDAALAGPQGPAGPQGATGPSGPAGANGATWTSGIGAPSGGADGDFHLRTSTGDVYRRASGTWSIVANITGPAGATGADGLPRHIADEGSALTDRATLNLTGAGITCTDNAGANRTDCAVPGGGGVGGITAPGTTTDTAIALWSGPTGSALLNSAVTVDGSGKIATPAGCDGCEIVALTASDPAVPLVYLSADSLALSDGDPVGTWGNLGSGADFTATGGNRPIFRANVLNGHASVDFDGSASCLTTSPASISAASFSIFLVFEGGPPPGMILEHGNDSNPGGWLYSGSNDTTIVRRTQAISRELVPGDHNNPMQPQCWGCDQQWHVIAWSFDGTYQGMRLWVDGAYPSMHLTSASSPLTGTATQPLYLGCRGMSGVWFTGKVLSLLIYSPKLNAVDERRVERALQQRYGL